MFGNWRREFVMQNQDVKVKVFATWTAALKFPREQELKSGKCGSVLSNYAA